MSLGTSSESVKRALTMFALTIAASLPHAVPVRIASNPDLPSARVGCVIVMAAKGPT